MFLKAYIRLESPKSNGLVRWVTNSWFGMKAFGVGFHYRIGRLIT